MVEAVVVGFNVEGERISSDGHVFEPMSHSKLCETIEKRSCKLCHLTEHVTHIDHSSNKRCRLTTEELQQQFQLPTSNHQRAACDSEETRNMHNETQESGCTWPMSDKMSSGKGSRASGRPIDSDFESAVLAKVSAHLAVTLSTKQDVAMLGKKNHGMHALNYIVLAGLATASEDTFRHQTKVKFLRFSKCWARGVLMRHASFPRFRLAQVEAS